MCPLPEAHQECMPSTTITSVFSFARSILRTETQSQGDGFSTGFWMTALSKSCHCLILVTCDLASLAAEAIWTSVEMIDSSVNIYC